MADDADPWAKFVKEPAPAPKTDPWAKFVAPAKQAAPTTPRGDPWTKFVTTLQNPDAANVQAGQPTITQRDVASAKRGTNARFFGQPGNQAEAEQARLGGIQQQAATNAQAFSQENPWRGKALSALEGVGAFTPIGEGGVTRGAALARSKMGKGSYEEELAKQRGIAQAAREENPKTYWTTGALSGLAPGAMSPYTAPASISRAGSAGRGALEGLGWGSLYGAAQSPDYGNLGQTLGSAAQGGAWGSLAGGLLGGATRPRTPADKFMRDTQDLLHEGQGAKTTNEIDWLQKSRGVPAEFANADVQKRMYQHMEGDPQGVLSPAEQTHFDTVIAPIAAENKQLVEQLRGAGVDAEDYVHRIVKDNPEWHDPISGEMVVPYQSGQGRGLGKSPAPTQERKFYALEDARGNRKLVSVGRYDTLNEHTAKGQTQRLNPVLSPLSKSMGPGAKMKIGGVDYEMKQAWTSEIEGKTGLTYHQGAYANTVQANVALKGALKNVETLDKIKNLPGASNFYLPEQSRVTSPRDWVDSPIPQMPGKMDPRLANTFKDFVGAEKGDLGRAFDAFNNVTIRSIFWNPLPHVENVGVHALVGRGWDNFTIAGTGRLFKTMPSAVVEVARQGPKFKEFLKNGGALISGPISSRGFYEQLGRRMGMDIEHNWGMWAPIMKPFGITSPTQAIPWFYNGMQKALWNMGDMFMMQRYLENTAKGMSIKEAIADAERHIPNYRVPDQILGSRAFQEAMMKPGVLMFSRYHYGMFKGFGEMARGLYQGNAAERMTEMGSVLALAVTMNYLYPLMDEGAKNLFGPDATKLRRGAASIPDWIGKMYGGDKDLPEIIMNSMTLAPAVREAGQQVFAGPHGRDYLTGQPIQTESGIPGYAQRTEHALGNLISPYSTWQQIWSDWEGGGRKGEDTLGQSAARVLERQVLGVHAPSERSAHGAQAAKHFQAKDAKSRAKNPRGPIERLGQKFKQEYGGNP